MFKRKSKTQDEPVQGETTPDITTSQPKSRKKRNWLIFSIVANVLLVSGIISAAGTAVVVHESDTNPEFCGTCHLMQSHVDSYLNGEHLDNLHMQAGVGCKDCHDYPLDEEIRAGIAFVTNDYEVDENGELFKRDFGDEICTQCHISLEHVATLTDNLYYNPHGTRMGTFPCATCHQSHGPQIDYCSECHTNGGQRMYGDETPHEQTGKPESPYGSMYGG